MSGPSPVAGVGALPTQDAPTGAGGSETAPAEALEYARRLFQNLTDWYNSADTKAQVILTLDGAFVAFLSSSMFAEPTQLRSILSSFSPATWALLTLMTLSLSGSIVSALASLWSRLYRPREVDELFRRLGVDVREADSYRPEVLWFFQFVGRLDQDQFRARLLHMDKVSEVDTLAFQIVALSANVSRKHGWVNAGFVLAGASFLLFLAAGASYLAGL